MTSPHPLTQDHAATAVLTGIFGQLPAEELEDLFEHLVAGQFNPGQAIVSEGDPADLLHFVVTGRARVWTNDDDAQTMMTIGPGDPIGASHVLNGDRHHHTVTALTFLETLALPTEQFQSIGRRHPAIYEVLCRTLSRDFVTVGAREKQAATRDLHSLAIVFADAKVLPIVRGLIDRLENDETPVRPLWVTRSAMVDSTKAGSVGGGKNDIDPGSGDVGPQGIATPSWAGPIGVEDLPMQVASASTRKTLAVVMAHDELTATAASDQCDRVVWIGNHSDSPAWFQRFVQSEAKPRTLLVRVFPTQRNDGSFAPTSLHPLDSVATVPVVCDGVRVAAGGLERIERSLRGRRIGLALGGGGARGIAHIGVLQVFAERGLVFDSVAGTSAGAIVGAAYAAGFAMDELAEIFRVEFTPPKWLQTTAAGRRWFLLRAFRSGRIGKIFEQVLGDRTFDDLELPFATTSVDLIAGRHVIHRSGRVVDAVLPSINHPAFGTPILRDGRALVDGGVLMNVPAPALSDDQCDLIISIDVGSQLSKGYAGDASASTKPPGYLATMIRTIDVAQRQASALHRDRSGYIVRPQTEDFRLEDFHAVDPLVQRGREAAEREWSRVQSLIQTD